jgi:hypothetical protein
MVFGRSRLAGAVRILDDSTTNLGAGKHFVWGTSLSVGQKA